MLEVQCHAEVLNKVLITLGLDCIGMSPLLRKFLASNVSADCADAGMKIRLIIGVCNVLVHVVQADTCNSVSTPEQEGSHGIDCAL